MAAIAESCLTGVALFVTRWVSLRSSADLPGIAMGTWLITTTSVSEFMAACDRMHMPQAVKIPFCRNASILPGNSQRLPSDSCCYTTCAATRRSETLSLLSNRPVFHLSRRCEAERRPLCFGAARARWTNMALTKHKPKHTCA